MKHRDAGGSVKRNKPGVVPTPENTLGVLSALMARPKEIPGDVVKLTVRMSKATKRKLEQQARREQRTLASVVRDVLEQGAA